MTKLKLILVIFILLSFCLPNFANAQEEPLNIYFFWGDGCPHCNNEKEFLNRIKTNYPQITIKDFEVWNNRDNAKLLQTIAEKHHLNIRGVPLTIIGSKNVAGFLNQETTGAEIVNMINQCLDIKCYDIVAPILNSAQPPEPQPLPQINKNDEK